MKILMVAAEVGPYVSVGGLSQVLYFLPQALTHQHDDVRIFTPKFGTMDTTAPHSSGWKLDNHLMGLHVPTGTEPDEKTDLICNVKKYTSPRSSVTTYFLENREYYELRANVFGYKDDHIRFSLLSKGCLEWLSYQKMKGDWFPDVIHCHDWHTSYLIEMARTFPRYKELLKNIPIVLTVHNFTYQGNFDYKYCDKKDRDDYTKPLLPFFDSNLQKQNALLRGIHYADAITTVSPTHAREVLTEEYGEGLHEVLGNQSFKLSGILNGLDTTEFNPEKDPLVPSHFSPTHFAQARQKNKRYLQHLFGITTDPSSFLMAYSGRLTNQKGLTLLLEAVKHILMEYEKTQLIVMGGGDESYREELTQLQNDFPQRVGLHLLPDFHIPRRIFAGADVLLIPSLFEPGGIVALEALRYGAVPVVRRTGGLNDIVMDFDPYMGCGNGFSFREKDSWSLHAALVTAYTLSSIPDVWHTLVGNALKSDFSWEEVGKKYHLWYTQVIRGIYDRR